MTLAKNRTTLATQILILAFVVYALWVSFVFFSDQLIHAASNPFWGDEVFGLEVTIRKFSYLDTILKGAYGQASPAPLDYLVCKVLDDLSASVHFFGFPQETYYRLWANLVTALTALVIMLAFSRRIFLAENPIAVKALQIILLSLMPVGLWYTYFVYHYAAEIRPYAAWNAMYFLTLAAGILRRQTVPPNNIFLITALVLLALTATAAVFQIGMLIVAYFLMYRLEKISLGSGFRELLKIFSIPVAIALFYCLKVGQLGQTRAANEYAQFWELWTHKSIIIVYMLIPITLCLLKAENRKYLAAPLAFLLLYLTGPLIYWLTRLKGNFFTERQYVYYDLMYAVFLLAFIQCLPAYLRDIRNKVLLAGLVVLISAMAGSMVLRPKFVRNFKNAVHNTPLWVWQGQPD